MLPYSFVEPYLRTHALVRATKLNPVIIHNAMLVILAHRERNTLVPKVSTVERTTYSCIACKSIKMLISEGHYVCECGVVQPGTITGMSYLDLTENMPTKSSKPKTKLATWLVNSIQPSDVTMSEVGKMVEHWNHWVNLGDDTIEAAKREALIVENTSIDVRCVAALLLQRILTLCDLDEIAEKCKNRLPLSPLVEVTHVTFDCKSCGENVSTKFEATHHQCEWHTHKRHKSTFMPQRKHLDKTIKMKTIK